MYTLVIKEVKSRLKKSSIHSALKLLKFSILCLILNTITQCNTKHTQLYTTQLLRYGSRLLNNFQFCIFCMRENPGHDFFSWTSRNIAETINQSAHGVGEEKLLGNFLYGLRELMLETTGKAKAKVQ